MEKGLKIFSYLPNPRVWKAEIAAKIAGIPVEVIGDKPSEISNWLWDSEPKKLSDSDKKGLKQFIKKALPLTIITGFIYLIAVFILTNSYDFDNAILKVIFIGLASLTFPHILLEYLIEKNEKRS